MIRVYISGVSIGWLLCSILFTRLVLCPLTDSRFCRHTSSMYFLSVSFTLWKHTWGTVPGLPQCRFSMCHYVTSQDIIHIISFVIFPKTPSCMSRHDVKNKLSSSKGCLKLLTCYNYYTTVLLRKILFYTNV